jgi:hypothetical protein
MIDRSLTIAVRYGAPRGPVRSNLSDGSMDRSRATDLSEVLGAKAATESVGAFNS